AEGPLAGGEALRFCRSAAERALSVPSLPSLSRSLQRRISLLSYSPYLQACAYAAELFCDIATPALNHHWSFLWWSGEIVQHCSSYRWSIISRKRFREPDTEPVRILGAEPVSSGSWSGGDRRGINDRRRGGR